MTEQPHTQIAGILDALRAGRATSEDLFVVVYDELRELARSRLEKERSAHSLQPTALVHEVYLRLGPNDVPWQRVVNAMGRCSTDRLPDMPTGLQQSLLEREGVAFDDAGRLDLRRYRWTPPEHRPRSSGRS